MATDSKKDLTGLMDYAKALEESGNAPPIPEGSVMEEQKVVAIDEFESLDDYGKANPAPEIPFETSSEPDAFALTPVEPGTGLQSLTGMDDAPPVEEPELEEPAKFDLDPATFGAHLTPSPAELSELNDLISVSAPSAAAPPEMTEPLRPAFQAPRAPQEAMDRVREYSEQLSPAKNSVSASFPFSLIITGHLATEEKARLLDLLSRENMGIREIDMEPQFESGKILIPRISEYAGVLIVSALRTASAKIRFGPSDSIFATEDTQDTHSNRSFDSGISQSASSSSSDSFHPAEALPITTEASLPGSVQSAMTHLIDVVTASAALKTSSVEAEHSPEYQMLLETLQRELKYKAFHKGATAIVSFSVQLTPLRQPTHYRVLVTGAAVKSPDL